MFSTAAHSSGARKDSLLTERRVDVSGVCYREIATSLLASETTVNREMRNIFNAWASMAPPPFVN